MKLKTVIFGISDVAVKMEGKRTETTSTVSSGKRKKSLS